MQSLKDKDSIKKIDIQELLKNGKYIYRKRNWNFDPDYYGIGIGTAYVRCKEMILQEIDFEEWFNPKEFEDNSYKDKKLDKWIGTIYFDEQGNMHEVVKDEKLQEKVNSIIEEIEQKVNGGIEGTNRNSENRHKHKVINFFRVLFSKKKLLEDNNSLTLEEIEERLAKVTTIEPTFIDKYSTEKTDAEKKLDEKNVTRAHTIDDKEERI